MDRKRNTALGCLGLFAAAVPSYAVQEENTPVPEEAQHGNRPNIIVILADDMGYSDLGCYGGEIETPNLDELASHGLRWKQFYNNARSCPSRAVLMTGLYPHQAGMGWMAAADLQTPQYQGYLNHNCVTIAEVLRNSGYGTYMCGKWHLSSDRQNQGAVTEAWPASRGFERFYGIPSGASNYFKTVMYNEDIPEETSEGFYITTALSDSASAFIRRHDYKEKPLFLYLAFNAPHWPLHAPEDVIEKYVDRYRKGWDILRKERFSRQVEMGLFREGTDLSPRDSTVAAWDTLTPEKQEEFARRMAIYAAQIDVMDQGVGKVVRALKSKGEFDNTVIMFMSDNGACAEFISGGRRKAVDGKEDTFESYRINWANMSSTPYREYKHFTNEGGIASPLIVSWPDGISHRRNGSFVDEYGYFADIMATCTDLSKAEYPTEVQGQSIHPMEGYSLRPNFKGRKTGRGMTFWEHEANIAVRDGKWKIVLKTGEGNKFNPAHIELYDIESDPSEMHNLAKTYPERTEKMLDAWNEWANRVHAFPLDTRFYGQRQAAYRRVVNGDFNDNFGGWTIHTPSDSSVTFSILRDGPWEGKCAEVGIGQQATESQTSANPLGNAFLKWNFPTDNSCTVELGFSWQSDSPNMVTLALERAGKPSDKLFIKEIELTNGSGTCSFDDIGIPEQGRWQLVLYFGKSSYGKILIDNVIMRFHDKQQSV